MSHQTGIKSNYFLKQMMTQAKFKENNTRLFKVVINTQTEELELENSQIYPVNSDWETDFEAYSRKVITPNEPCYFFFRMDSTNTSGWCYQSISTDLTSFLVGFYDWAFILFSPEYSNVRKKMLYASTKSSLKNEFGTGIVYDYFADSEEALSIKKFRAWIQDKQKLAKGVNVNDMDADVDDLDDDNASFNSSFTSNVELLTANEDERRKVKQLEYEMSLEKKSEK